MSATLQAGGTPLAGSARWNFTLDGWTLIAAAIGMLVAVPVGSVLFTALGPSDGIWGHLVSTVLWVYVGNTLWLMLGVGAGTIVIGTSTAWLVTMYRFPGRRILSWALLLPLAVPGYILAFVITDQLEYAGNVQSALRGVFGWTSPREYWFPEIRSLGGATVVLSLVLYPYVYLLARAAFIEQSFGLFETSRTLGRGPVASFFTVAMPLARPAIAVGVALALMETLNEFGTIDFFAVPTLTAGIFDVWLNMDSTAGAAQLASVLVAFTPRPWWSSSAAAGIHAGITRPPPACRPCPSIRSRRCAGPPRWSGARRRSRSDSSFRRGSWAVTRCGSTPRPSKRITSASSATA